MGGSVRRVLPIRTSPRVPTLAFSITDIQGYQWTCCKPFWKKCTTATPVHNFGWEGHWTACARGSIESACRRMLKNDVMHLRCVVQRIPKDVTVLFSVMLGWSSKGDGSSEHRRTIACHNRWGWVHLHRDAVLHQVARSILHSWLRRHYHRQGTGQYRCFGMPNELHSYQRENVRPDWLLHQVAGILRHP